MAGNYPDPTSWRMALDRDGSVLVEIGSSTQAVYQLTAGQVTGIAGESGTVYTAVEGGLSGILAVIFPELRDIDAWYLAVSGLSGASDNVAVDVSTNTTNGLDGTWNQIDNGSVEVHTGSVGPWRTGIRSGTALAVRGIRFHTPGAAGSNKFAIYALHLYGEVSPGSPDRLAFWSATADQKMPPATPDFGDVPRSSSDDFVVRVKNLSATKTAGNVIVSFDILTDGVPTVPAQHLVSTDGVTFTAQVNIGSLAPGAISAPVTVRRVTPSNAQLGLWAPRMSAVPGTWA